MKKEIHPAWNKQAKVLLNGKVIMTVGSTSPEMSVEIWAGNHPFITGKEVLVDVDNLVEKFKKKIDSAKSSPVLNKKQKLENRKQKSAQKTGNLTLKDMLDKIK